MIDDAIHAWFQSHRVPWVTQLMLLVTYFHEPPGLLAMAAALGLLLWWRRERWWLGVLACAVPGAMLLNVAAKNIIQRARPHVAEPLLLIDSYAFPSGHAAGTTALYACAAAWLLSHLRQRPAALRWWVGLAAAMLVAWVCASRLYLGVHYLSDVVAGCALGLTWVLLCMALWRRGGRP